MHWTTALLLTLLSISPPTLARTTRILTKFTPSCHTPSEAPDTDDLDFNLDEEFTVGLNIRSGICQGVPVPLPLGFYDEVDYVSLELVVPEPHVLHTPRASNNSPAPNLEVCTVRLFERPGCDDLDTPLIQREFGVGAGVGGSSQCVQRSVEYMGLGEVFVRIDCVDGSLPRPGPGVDGGLQDAGNNGTVVSFANGTASATMMARSKSGIGAVLGRWQRRRVALLGR
ncbi:uncharacterized protein DSM5745_01677 [Aspergillus mulundensis]|uniref:Uncharacterized protein n=1 Tax=Aspergillus mulundensis TaxID=1810919 RepID=A0A3D8SUA9_9EURO|nr:hypothetical protein DSM5745_01677 [Aspergillus mulundensis]RDW89902.1 hypothetical protein DSM5745_01677 [Aspergillus mulundensis]